MAWPRRCPVATLATAAILNRKIRRREQQWSGLKEWVNSLDDQDAPAD